MERKGEHKETEEKRIGRKRQTQRKKEKVSKGETKKETEKLINKKRQRMKGEAERDRDKMRDRKICKIKEETGREKEGGFNEIQRDIDILAKICLKEIERQDDIERVIGQVRN